MGGRYGLVVTTAAEPLRYVPQIPRDLADVWFDPELGGCASALPADTQPLINPTAALLDMALRTVFEWGSASQATLLLAVIGQAEYVDGDCRLLIRGAPEPFPLASRIGRLLREYPLIDGLGMLIDTCHADLPGEQQVSYWIDQLGPSGRRFELLTGTAGWANADGCAIQTVAHELRSGSTAFGQRVLCDDLRTRVDTACHQALRHWSYDGARVRTDCDPALWWAHNPRGVWSGSPFAGTAVADEAERLTRNWTPRPAFAELATALVTALRDARCVVLSGGPDSGKSVSLAALVHPTLARAVVPRGFLHAVAWNADQHTVSHVAEDLADQLSRTVPGFATATSAFLDSLDGDRWDTIDELERHVLGPLRQLSGRDQLGGRDEPIRIAVDVQRRLPSRLRDLLWRLAAEPEPGNLRLILTTRDEHDLPPGAVPIRLDSAAHPPVAVNIAIGGGNVVQAGTVTGGISYSVPGVAETAAVLRAAGPYSDISTSMLASAAESLGGPGQVPLLHDALRVLHGLVVRCQAGTDAERVSLLDVAAIESLTGAITPRQAQWALLHGCRQVAPVTEHDPRRSADQEFAELAEAELLFQDGRHADALASLIDRVSASPAANRDRWTAAVGWFTRSPGPTDEVTLEARVREATWTAKAGDPDRALELLRPLVSDCQRQLGERHRITLSARHNRAYWAEYPDEFDQLAVLFRERSGPEHKDTLDARLQAAIATAKRGDAVAALARFRDVLPVCERALGAGHKTTVSTIDNMLYWGFEIGDPPPRRNSASTSFSWPARSRTMNSTVSPGGITRHCTPPSPAKCRAPWPSGPSCSRRHGERWANTTPKPAKSPKKSNPGRTFARNNPFRARGLITQPPPSQRGAPLQPVYRFRGAGRWGFRPTVDKHDGCGQTASDLADRRYSGGSR